MKLPFYLDADAVNSLYYQCVETPLSKRSSLTEIQASKKFGGLLNALGGVISGEAGREKKTVTSHQDEEMFPIEMKIREVISHISPSNQGPLEFLFNRIDMKEGSQIVLTSSFFTIARLYLTDKPKVDYRTHQADILSSPKEMLSWDLLSSMLTQHYDPNPGHSTPFVSMHMSGTKLQRETRHITNAIEYGHEFDLSILGEISHDYANVYTIKPIVVWR